MRRIVRTAALSVPLFVLLVVVIYFLPPVNERLAWRVSALRAKVQYSLRPPEEAVFVPQQAASAISAEARATINAIVDATLDAASARTPTPTTEPPTPTASPAGPSPTPTVSPTPSATPTPLPAQVQLNGITHEYQKWNNCGPANLSMALSYWGWEGDQLVTAAFLKPNERDKNVMPYEMASFVEQMTGFGVLVRQGGDLETLKAFIAAGFPVIVEKGFEGTGFDGWMGHYEVVNGYDDARERFTVQDSYIKANLPIPYAEMLAHWQAFNYLYIVVYPPEREAEVLSVLGPQSDESYNIRHAAEKAANETYSEDMRAQYFAWYNRGTSLMQMQDYNGAAEAYDRAFALYPSIPENRRPWRMVWYQTGPYFAYFFTQRYYDLVALATTTIGNSPEPAIEESFYWRARAFYELYLLEGDESFRQNAIEDFRRSLEWHPNFEPTLYQAQALGLEL